MQTATSITSKIMTTATTKSTNTMRHLIALSLISLLSACSSNTPAPISSINDSLPPASVPPRPQAATPQIQSLPMQQPLQQSSTSEQQPVTQDVNRSTTVQAAKTATQQTVVSDKVQMRDGHIVYNRQYGEIPKGSYTGNSSYTVKHGDTLFYIAWITGNDYRDLAKRNNIPEPYSLKPGQILQVENASGTPLTGENAISRADASSQPATSQTATQDISSKPATASATTDTGSQGKQNNKKMLPGNKNLVNTTPVTNNSSQQNITPPQQPAAGNIAASAPALVWRWPTTGKIIENFSTGNGDNKGIDIAGKQGQPILAAASGRVVYAGNALRGYGNLIIIKHNDDYLSAYAHNNTMLVREQQDIKAGQQIATMGNTGTSSTRLHFEVRYKGKPVNPLRYLPQR